MSEISVLPDPWAGLRRHTPARIALGRVGASLPSAEVLSFAMAHARARDAVHHVLDTVALATSLEQAGFSTLQVRSQATSRTEYLSRPDLGRRLALASRSGIMHTEESPRRRLTVVVADGLSSLAPERHALPLLAALRTRLVGWSLDAVIVATQARVALADEIGELRGAEAVVILLGERPGLSSPDSLGAYLTYAPRRGRLDADRNCISNVREGGLGYAEAAHTLAYLLGQSRAAGRSGIAVKDSSEGACGQLAIR